jgi:nucleotide-binding universal stress UspA family protein
MYALQRADALARDLGADLHVVHGTGRTARRSNASSAAKRLEAARERALAWCDAVLARRFEGGLMVDPSDIVEASVAASYLVAPMFIVIGAASGTPSHETAHSIARRILDRAGRPVLLARALGSSRRILAATDFTDGRFPVLTYGRALGAGIGAPVTWLHDAGSHDNGEVARRRRQLQELSKNWRTATDAAVVNAGTPTDTILGAARRNNADMIVIGAHVRRGPLHMFVQRTSDRVVDHAEQSVLVVPVLDSHAA